ncbi:MULTISPECIES: tellurite resistance TerB family protein [Oceanisphaera]|uniref:Tellurite resistance TerB family protein n=1 Tax=Oceanisphaera ostreae TaxID=914151 RepID=A0ABW3KM66_9GAMM
MSFFNKIKDSLNSGRNELATRVSKYKNRKFMEGTVAACAYVAMASDGVSAEEKQKMIGFIKNSPELSVFDTEQIIEVFNKLASNFEFDKDIGKGEAMKLITRMRDETDAAQLMLRVAIAIGKSDGDFDAEEKASAKEICVALGLSPTDFDL